MAACQKCDLGEIHINNGSLEAQLRLQNERISTSVSNVLADSREDCMVAGVTSQTAKFVNLSESCKREATRQCVVRSGGERMACKAHSENFRVGSAQLDERIGWECRQSIDRQINFPQSARRTRVDPCPPAPVRQPTQAYKTNAASRDQPPYTPPLSCRRKSQVSES